MTIPKFRSPSKEFVQEMLNANLTADKPALVLSHVPKRVLEQIVHHAAVAKILEEPTPSVDISVGPDEEYHHQIQGIATVGHNAATLFYQGSDAWYSLYFSNHGKNNYEVLCMKLISDKADKWEVLDLEDEEHLATIRGLSRDAFQYLGLLPSQQAR